MWRRAGREGRGWRVNTPYGSRRIACEDKGCSLRKLGVAAEKKEKSSG